MGVSLRASRRYFDGDVSAYQNRGNSLRVRSRPMKVVLDTSVLVAAARSKSGASHALLARLLDARLQPVVSVPLFC